MWKRIDIIKALRLIIVMLPLVLAVTSCTEDNLKGGSQQGLMDVNADTDNLAAEHRKCWQSAFIEDFYNVMSRSAFIMYTRITDGALVFMMTAFAVWFAFRLLKHLGSVMEENAAEVWTEVVNKLFLCFALGTIASSPAYIIFFLNLVVFPIYMAFLEFGSEIVNASVSSGTVVIDGLGEVIRWDNSDIICKISPLTGEAIASNGVNGTINFDDVAFPEEPKKMMSCLICTVNDRMSIGMKLAFAVLKGGGIMTFLVGLMMIICFFFVKMGFVFYLVDSIFKFTIIATILPLLIMGYAFENTRKWMTSGFKSMLSSAAFMAMIALMMAMSMMALQELMTQEQQIFKNSETDGDFKGISAAVLCLVSLCFLIVSSVSIAKDLAGQVTGASIKDSFQKKFKAVAETGLKLVLWSITGTVTAMKTAAKKANSDKDADKAGGAPGGKAAKGAGEAAKGVDKGLDEASGKGGDDKKSKIPDGGSDSNVDKSGEGG